MAVQGVQPFQMFIMVVFLILWLPFGLLLSSIVGEFATNFMLIVVLKSCRKCRSVRMKVCVLFVLIIKSLFFTSQKMVQPAFIR